MLESRTCGLHITWQREKKILGLYMFSQLGEPRESSGKRTANSDLGAISGPRFADRNVKYTWKWWFWKLWNTLKVCCQDSQSIKFVCSGFLLSLSAVMTISGTLWKRKLRRRETVMKRTLWKKNPVRYGSAKNPSWVTVKIWRMVIFSAQCWRTAENLQTGHFVLRLYYFKNVITVREFNWSWI
jgi:hypothetical protein